MEAVALADRTPTSKVDIGSPPPLSRQQARAIAQIFSGAAEQRVRKARLDGATPERHDLERRVPGRPRSTAIALREYQENRAKTLEEVDAEDRVLWQSSLPEAELMFRWRIKLGCGDVTEILSLGNDRPPTELTWTWGGTRLGRGAYTCSEHWAKEPPYRRVERYLDRSTLDLKGDEEMGWEPRTAGYWKVSLECGHLAEQITPLDWRPEDGHQQTAPNDPAEVARRRARADQIKDIIGVTAYEHLVRRIDQGHPEPDLETTCWVCQHEQPIVTFQRVGWLVPPPRRTASAPEVAARPTRAQLEKRVAALEAENSRLRDGERSRR